jgi:Tfp pilus assembly protein PilO
MRNLALTKKRFMIALGVMGLLDVVLLAYLWWPGSSPSALESQRKTLQEQARSLSREVAPLDHIGDKLAETRKNIDLLYKDRIPHRSSQISQQLEKLTRETGVKAQSIRYNTTRPEKGDLPDVQRMGIETTVTGDYAKIARFINTLEQSELVFIIDQVTLSEQQGGMVSLQIKFETFLREM